MLDSLERERVTIKSSLKCHWYGSECIHYYLTKAAIKHNILHYIHEWKEINYDKLHSGALFLALNYLLLSFLQQKPTTQQQIRGKSFFYDT